MEMMYCLNCNNEFEVDGLCRCPRCGAVGDDLEPYEEEIDEGAFDEYEPTEEDLEAMYEDYLMRQAIENEVALIGAQ